MTASTNVTVQKMELTPQRVTFDGADLGGTLDGVEITPEISKGEIKADQTGTTVRDRRINGIALKIKTKIAEIRDPAVWAKVFPSADYVDSGGDKAIQFGLPIGRSDLDNAKLLQLHPVVLDDSDLSQDHNFYAAYPEEVSAIKYGPEEQSGLEITWNAYLITGGTEAAGGYKLYRFGDPDVVIP